MKPPPWEQEREREQEREFHPDLQPLQSSRSDKVPTKAETGSDADVYPTLKPADPYCPQGSWDDDLELADPSPFFQCDICKNAEKRFTGSDVLLKHMRTVHGCERPHVCPLCAHGFPLADLKRHNKGQGQCGGKRSSMSSSNVLVDGKPPSFKQPDSNVSVKNYNRIFGNYTYAKDQKGISSSTTPQANLETIYPSSTSHIEPPMESSMEFIIFTVSKEISSTDSDFLLNVEWDLLGFMRNQFVDFSNANLGSVITLTGTAQNAQATTCLDYAERNWPFQGSMLIEAFQSAIDSDVHTSKALISGVDIDINLVPRYCVLYLESPENPRAVAKLVQQAIWMGAALRISKNEHVQYSNFTFSKFDIERSGWSNVTYHTTELGKEEQSCWLPLFANPVIARGFPIRERENGEQGLELPLEMMAALGGARHATDFDGGVVLKGHSAMFVPVNRYPQSIQWHLIRRSDEQRILYRELIQECPNRAMLEEVDYESLQITRAFLGWWKSSETYLGTRDAAYESIDWSPAGEARRSIRLSGANIGFSKIVTGQLNFIMGAKDGSLHISQKGPFQRIVQCAERTPVALYDHKDRRAFFVPGLNVVLHILGTRHHISPYKIDGKDVELSPLDPGKHKFAAAEAVAANQSRLLSEGDVPAEKGYYFKDAILDIWSQMERLMEKDDSIEATPGLALHGTTQDKLCGWEFMSLVDEKNFRRKEVNVAKSSGGWVDLVDGIDGLVLFGTGFGEIIRPVSDLSNLCREWRSLPVGKDYLAASVSILELLYSEAGSRDSRKHLSSNHLQWHRGSLLFEDCEGMTPNRCDCDRTQQIYHDSLFRTFGRVRPPGKLEENGCVVFGQIHHPFKRNRKLTIRENAIHNLPNTSIQDVGIAKKDQVRTTGIPSQYSPASISPDPRDIDSYTVQSSKRPPSPLNSNDGCVHGIAESKRRRTMSQEELHQDEDQISLSDDYAICPQEFQSMLKHNTQSKGRCLLSTRTACASKAECDPAPTWIAKKGNAEIKEHGHCHGCSCSVCSHAESEPHSDTESVSDTSCV